MQGHPEQLREQALARYVPGVFGFRRVAAEMGVSSSTVKRWLQPEYAESQRVSARKRKLGYRGTCIDCGATTSYSGHGTMASLRCSECSLGKQHSERYWTRERVIDAIRSFATQHGRPPIATEWLYGSHGKDSDGYPHASVVLRECGTWADAIEAAGFPRPTRGHNHRGRKDWQRSRPADWRSVDDVLYQFRALSVDGVAPSSHEHPNLWHALNYRGMSWGEACRFCGLRQRPRGRQAKAVAE